MPPRPEGDGEWPPALLCVASAQYMAEPSSPPPTPGAVDPEDAATAVEEPGIPALRTDGPPLVGWLLL